MALIRQNERINQPRMFLEAGFSDTGILNPFERD